MPGVRLSMDSDIDGMRISTCNPVMMQICHLRESEMFNTHRLTSGMLFVGCIAPERNSPLSLDPCDLDRLVDLGRR